MKIDLPCGMDGETIWQAIYCPGKGVQSPILARVPRMSGTGIPIPLQNQVQVWPWLKIEGKRVANPFPSREAGCIKLKWRADDEEIIDVGAIGPAIAQSPVNTDRPRLTSHKKIDAIDGILIAVRIAEPPFRAMGLNIDERFQGKAGKANRT